MTIPAVGPASGRPAARGRRGRVTSSSMRGAATGQPAPRPSAARGPTGPAASVPLTQRAGGPDLARGLALLGIAMANTVGWLHGTQWTVLLKQADATVADRIVNVIAALTVDNRGFPLFALLFGYGIGVLHRRSLARGERSRTFLGRMLRRHLVLLALGLAHGILLFSGDILASYAIIGMLCAVLVSRRSRWLLPLAMLLTVPLLAPWGWADATYGLIPADGYPDASAATYLEGLEIRARDMLYGVGTALVMDLGLLGPMAIGAIAARIHLLEQVTPNRDLLRPITAGGIAVGLAGAVPLTAVLVADPHHAWFASEVGLGILGVLHQLTGVAGALGAATGAALVADAVRGPADAVPGPADAVRGHADAVRGPADAVRGHAGESNPEPSRRKPVAVAVHGVEALGATALTAYVLQSVIFLALYPPYTLDLGARIGSAWSAVIVLAGWLVMIVLASGLRRAGRRGPLEFVLRRLAGSTSPRGSDPGSADAASVGPSIAGSAHSTPGSRT
ncbi:DUF418 domain-containing protein [Brachybacterium sp. p3-SID957]|uniref:DUF418 domain-containing protein n=1 Tax=Brachybacterium sp. p3-SID957 TaxID=2916049 RepID=UPI00223A6BBE|nr:DUF418 domain-containing protein [Brachybacterium sp. p3-SID957]MCT1775281.1 DUF418 domain-containing protein [Brachybacterium sp. p3-SID957]